MSYYVNKDAYRAELEAHLARLAAPPRALPFRRRRR